MKACWGVDVCFLTALQPLWALAAFQFPDLFTIGGTSWTSDQLVARPLPKHRAAQTQNKHIYTPNIHSLSRIWTHDHSVWASEDSSCRRPLSYRDWWSGCIDPCLLDLGTSWRWVVSFSPRSLYPRGESPQYPLNRRLSGPQNQSGRNREVKILDPTGTRTLTPLSSRP
jgi:hypothetical protein